MQDRFPNPEKTPSEASTRKLVLRELAYGGTLWEVPGRDFCRLESRTGKLVETIPTSLALAMAHAGSLSRGARNRGVSYALTRRGTVEARLSTQTKTAP
jgi:hypothetical protein